MFWRSLFFGLQVGVAVSAVVAVVFAFWEWLENPGGIFRNFGVTNWSFVVDTALSWFLPTLLLVGGIAALAHLIWRYIQRRNCTR